MERKLITNFNAPKELRKRFDETCRMRGKTRTTVLIELMEHYVLSQAPVIFNLNERFVKLDQIIANFRRTIDLAESTQEYKDHARQGVNVEPDYDEEPLPMFFSDGREDW